MEIKIKKASELGDAARNKIAELFVEGFYDTTLKYFSKDKVKLRNAFSPLLVLDLFYVAVVEDKIVGMAAHVGSTELALNLDKKILQKYLGLIRGLFFYFTFKSHAKHFKIGAEERTAIIDCLATDPKFTGCGVATTLMKYILGLPEWEHFVLDVVDTNEAAIGLYLKLGFHETGRRKAPQGSGFNYIIYMKK